MQTVNEISGAIVDASLKIHRELGPGLLETVYRKVLAHELRSRGFKVAEEVDVPVEWQGVRLEVGFRADLVVNDCVVVELKSVERLAPVHKKQLLTYLRLMDKRLGLLINFNVELIKQGITRIVNKLPE